MNCCDANGKCHYGPGCPARPFFITDEGAADIDTESPQNEIAGELPLLIVLAVLIPLACIGLGFLLAIASARGWLPI